MSSIVPSEGSVDARIFLVGECPGATEEREGRPFIGGAGMVLNGLLADAHIARESCYITNVVKVRPPANKFSWFYEKKKVEKKVRLVPKPELQAGIEELHGELRAVAPNVIVPLGNEALKAVMGLDGITDWRGSILESPFGKVIPTYHPAAIMRMWPWRPVGRPSAPTSSTRPSRSKTPSSPTLGLRWTASMGTGSGTRRSPRTSTPPSPPYPSRCRRAASTWRPQSPPS